MFASRYEGTVFFTHAVAKRGGVETAGHCGYDEGPLQ